MKNIVKIFIQDRVSPVSPAAIFLTWVLVGLAVVTSLSMQLTFTALPNLVGLIGAVLFLDVVSQFAPQTRNVKAVQQTIFGMLYLSTVCLSGILAAYATQRLAFPLRDRLFEHIDQVLGVNWLAVVLWVDQHPAIHAILDLAYKTMPLQIALPVIVLAFSDRPNELKRYLLGFTIALVITTVVAALLPAVSPIAQINRHDFHNLHFEGATPLDHLARLRSGGAIVLGGDKLGGILSFPSFHAVVAVLTPLALRKYRYFLFPLVMVNVAMLISTLTEGAHYLSDSLAGCVVALVAYLLAKRIIRTPLATRT